MESSSSLPFLSNNLTKLLRQLKQRKYRYKYSKFVIEGVKIVTELIHTEPDWIEFVACKENSGREEVKNLDFEKVYWVDSATFDEVSSLDNSQGMLAVVRFPEISALPINFSFYLDGIQDPGNLGTIIRICDWFGVNQLYLGQGTVDPYNSKTVQASMGSILRVNCESVSLEELTGQFETIGTSLKGSSVHKKKTQLPLLIVLGNESQGISEGVESLCDQLWKIDSQSLGAESLNVASAASIFAFEAHQLGKS